MGVKSKKLRTKSSSGIFLQKYISIATKKPAKRNGRSAQMISSLTTVLGGWLLLVSFFSCTSTNNKNTMANTTYAFRLKPGQDLKQEILKVVTEKQVKAGWINTCVGSLTDYNIRFANQPEGAKGSGHFEIVSLVGTLSVNGSHIHISISDSTGKTIGGHLMEGCKIYTTAEIVIQASSGFEFTREKDGSTPWEELQVKQLTDDNK